MRTLKIDLFTIKGFFQNTVFFLICLLSCSVLVSSNSFSIFKCGEKVSAADVPPVSIPKGLQTWQWRAGVIDSTKSLIKILIETIRQWQIHCDLDPGWHDWGEPVKMSRPWQALSSVEEPTELACFSFPLYHLLKHNLTVPPLLCSSTITQFSVTLHIKPPVWPNFPMSRMY